MTQVASPRVPATLPRAHGLRALSRWLRHPSWPLTLLFAWYPLWWILGVQEIVPLLLIVPMALNLLKQRHLRLPPAFACWALFLVWALSGIAVLQVDAPGAVPGDSIARYLTWTFRYAWYVGATVTVLYVGNNWQSLGARRLSRILGYMFVTVTVGGLAGTFFPHVELKSALEVLLPGPIANQGFVHSLIHPSLAQIQTILGDPAPRPSAPFSYTNGWGRAYAVLLPLFLHGWLGRGAGWRRWVAVPILVASIVPAVYSANRGMWGALALMAVFVAVRAVLQGRATTVIALLLLTGLGAAVVVTSPLGGIVQERLAGGAHDSTGGRLNRADLTVQSVLGKSPLVGYGTTREVQGNFNSVAGGDSALCPHCRPPPLGTQGQVWLVLFSQGIVGAGLFFGFFILTFLRHVRSRAPTTTVALCVLLANFVTMAVYTSLGVTMNVVFIAIAILWAESDRRRQPLGGQPAARPRPLARTLLRRRLGIVVVATAIGGSVGVAWQSGGGGLAQASAAVWLPDETRAVQEMDGALSIDTLAHVARSEPVVRATRQVRDPRDDDTGLTVTATANTRILHLHFTSHDAGAAQRAVEAAMRSFVHERDALVSARRTAAVDELESRIADLTAELNTADERLSWMERHTSATDAALAPLHRRQTQVDTQISRLRSQWQQIRSAPDQHSLTVRPTTVRLLQDNRTIALTSGLFSGLIVGLILAMFVERGRDTLRRTRDVAPMTGLAVLAAVRDRPTETSSAPGTPHDVVTETLRAFGPHVCLAADPRDRRASRVADWLDNSSAQQYPGESPAVLESRVIIVVSSTTRASNVWGLVERLRLSGVRVVGVVAVQRA